MALEEPCILAPFSGAEIAGGATIGTISVVYNGVREALPFPGVGALDLSRWYWVARDAQADGAALGGVGDLVEMLDFCLEAHGQNPVVAITPADARGLLQMGVAGPGGSITLDGAHVDTTVDLSIWGLDPAAANVLGSGATPFPFRHRRGWYPAQYQAGGGGERLSMVGGVARPIAGRPRAVVLPAGPRERELVWTSVDAHRVRLDDAAADGPWSALETTWEEAIGLGYPWRFYQDQSIRAVDSYAVYELGEWPGAGYPWTENTQDERFWDVRLLGVRRTA